MKELAMSFLTGLAFVVTLVVAIGGPLLLFVYLPHIAWVVFGLIVLTVFGHSLRNS